MWKTAACRGGGGSWLGSRRLKYPDRLTDESKAVLRLSGCCCTVSLKSQQYKTVAAYGAAPRSDCVNLLGPRPIKWLIFLSTSVCLGLHSMPTVCLSDMKRWAAAWKRPKIVRWTFGLNWRSVVTAAEEAISTQSPFSRCARAFIHIKMVFCRWSFCLKYKFTKSSHYLLSPVPIERQVKFFGPQNFSGASRQNSSCILKTPQKDPKLIWKSSV